MMIVHVTNENFLKITMNKDLLLKIVGATGFSILALWGIFNLFTKPLAEPTKADITISKDDVILGNADAPVTLVEFSDLQCPACAAYAPILKEVVDTYKGKVRLVYKHFPLDQHVHAKKAAYAAEAANKQGKFFEFSEVLFSKQSEWQDLSEKDVDAKFASYAKSLSLDMKKYEADRKDPAIAKKVEADMTAGIAAGVNSTPSFFLNGTKLSNPRNLEEFKQLIDKELPAQKSTDSAKTK